MSLDYFVISGCKKCSVPVVVLRWRLEYNGCYSISFMLQSPLYGAAVNGHIAVVEMLLKAGADVNKVSHFPCDLFPLWSEAIIFIM